MADGAVPVTRFSAIAFESGWMNWTVLPRPIEKLVQSMIALGVLWVRTMAAPDRVLLSVPARTVAPVGNSANAGNASIVPTLAASSTAASSTAPRRPDRLLQPRAISATATQLALRTLHTRR